MPDQIKNVFISHVHEDDAGLEKIKDLLSKNKKNKMKIRDSSINSSNPNNAKSDDYIKYQVLAPQINWAGVLLVYLSSETKGSKWVDWEIEYAHGKGKRIVGVWAYGEKGCDLPEALENYADAVVGWNGSSLINAINGQCDVWEKPDGKSYPPRPIRRHQC